MAALDAGLLTPRFRAALAGLARRLDRHGVPFVVGGSAMLACRGLKVSVADLKERVKQIKSLDDNVATLERIVEKTEKYGVDLERTPFSIGPLLQFDPESETFVDNDAANAMLTREYRKPFVVPKPEDV